MESRKVCEDLAEIPVGNAGNDSGEVARANWYPEYPSPIESGLLTADKFRGGACSTYLFWVKKLPPRSDLPIFFDEKTG